MTHRRLTRIISIPSGPAIVGLSSLILVVAGCEKTEIHAYRVPHENETQSLPQAPKPVGEVGWTVPDTWHEVETTVQMRVATLMTDSGVEVALTAFPGDVGGLLANVNRWRGQVGLEPTDEQGAEDSIERVDGKEIIVVDVTGADKRLVGTMISVGDGKTWFVKATGEPDAIEAIKPDLVAFSKTFHLHEDGQGGGSEPASRAAVDSGQSVREQWRPPEQWKTDPNASQILSAAYLADDGARITLTALGGQGGGLLGNINRWRGQVGLAPVDSLDGQDMKDLGNGGVLVDLVAKDGSSRIVTAVVPAGSQTLFFKLTGSEPQVEAELERFEAFVNQVGLGKRG